MSPAQLISVFKARQRTIFWIFAGVLTATVLISLLMPRQYMASTDIVIDLKPDPVNGGLPPGLMMRPYLRTQAQIAASERLRLMVVDRLDLTKRGDFIERYGLSGEQSARMELAEAIADDLKVVPGKDSTFLTISYRGHSPEVAAQVANGFAQAFIDTSIEMRTQPASQRRDWYIKQSANLRAELDAAQKRLTEFQRSKNILASTDANDIGQQRLEALSSTLLQANELASNLTSQAQRARQAQSAQKTETIPQIIQSNSISELKRQRANLRSRYNEQLAVYGKNHPQMQRVSNELWSVGQRIKAESETIITGLETARDNAIDQRNRIAAAMNTQEQALLTDRNDRESLSLMQRDVSNAQRAYDEVLAQLNKSNLQSESDYANVFVLSKAQEPTEAASPNLLMNTALGAFIGMLLALGITLLMELINRRAYSGEDFARATGTPTLGSVDAIKPGRFDPNTSFSAQN